MAGRDQAGVAARAYDPRRWRWWCSQQHSCHSSRRERGTLDAVSSPSANFRFEGPDQIIEESAIGRNNVCAKCHGETGISTGAATPSLAGQDATYMLDALRAYKDGTRDDDTMSPKAKKLDDVEMKNLAAYYAALDPKPVNIPKPLSPDEWAEKCDRCHGDNGNSMRPDAPALAAQRLDYLEKVLKAYQTGARKSPEMAAMSSVLTEDDIAGIAAHYAFQKGAARGLHRGAAEMSARWASPGMLAGFEIGFDEPRVTEAPTIAVEDGALFVCGREPVRRPINGYQYE